MLLVAPMAASAAVVNFLANPGFETGDFSDWTVGGISLQTQVDSDGVLIQSTFPIFGPTYQNVHSGHFAANALLIQTPAPNLLGHIFLDQVISVLPNQTYNIGYYIGVDSPDYFQYGFSNGNAILVDDVPLALMGLGVISPGDGTGSNPDDFRHVSASYTTDSNQITATISFQISGSGNSRAGFSLDDFHFTGEQILVTPIPAAFWLFGSALIGLVGFSRRKMA